MKKANFITIFFTVAIGKSMAGPPDPTKSKPAATASAEPRKEAVELFPVRSKIAQYDGEFTALRKAGDTVSAGDLIGEIYYGGILNRQFAPGAGVLIYILSSGAQAEENTTKVCSIAPFNPGVAATK